MPVDRFIIPGKGFTPTSINYLILESTQKTVKRNLISKKQKSTIIQGVQLRNQTS